MRRNNQLEDCTNVVLVLSEPLEGELDPRLVSVLKEKHSSEISVEVKVAPEVYSQVEGLRKIMRENPDTCVYVLKERLQYTSKEFAERTKRPFGLLFMSFKGWKVEFHNTYKSDRIIKRRRVFK